ncbi:MAG TPA: hypothetical protein VFV34_24360 [Blastocatellia bacterium]|nr:hypothetical protein [Blastocatellia bacterium]
MSESTKERSILAIIGLTFLITVDVVLVTVGVQLLLFGKTVRGVTLGAGIGAGLATANVLRLKARKSA